jgi:hypothetical protein
MPNEFSLFGYVTNVFRTHAVEGRALQFIFFKFLNRNIPTKKILGRIKKLGCEHVDWIWLTHNRVKWCAFVNTMMNFHIP